MLVKQVNQFISCYAEGEQPILASFLSNVRQYIRVARYCKTSVPNVLNIQPCPIFFSLAL